MITIHTPGNARLVSPAQVQAMIPGMTELAANALIDQASSLIASETRRVLHRQEVTETWRDVSCAGLMLSRWPVASVVSVIEDGVTLAATDHEVDGSFLHRLSGDRRTGWRAAKIQVRYQGGYDPIPADLQRACIDLCVNMNAAAGRDMTIRSVSIPDVENVSYRDEANGGGLIPEHVASIIALYRDVML